MNPSNPEAARLVKQIEWMDEQTRVVRNQLGEIQAACPHQFPEKYDQFGNWCIHCNKYFTAMQLIDEERRASANTVVAVDDLAEFDHDFDDGEDFIDEDDVYGEDGLD